MNGTNGTVTGLRELPSLLCTPSLFTRAVLVEYQPISRTKRAPDRRDLVKANVFSCLVPWRNTRIGIKEHYLWPTANSEARDNLELTRFRGRVVRLPDAARA